MLGMPCRNMLYTNLGRAHLFPSHLCDLYEGCFYFIKKPHDYSAGYSPSDIRKDTVTKYQGVFCENIFYFTNRTSSNITAMAAYHP